MFVISKTISENGSEKVVNLVKIVIDENGTNINLNENELSKSLVSPTQISTTIREWAVFLSLVRNSLK